MKPFIQRPLPALLAAVLGAGMLSPAHAVPRDPPPRAYAIGAAPLADVLNRFAAESGVILAFDAALLRGQRSAGLRGSYDVHAGFRALLADTKYEAVAAPAGGYVLRERPPPPRPRDTVSASRQPEALQAIEVEASRLGGVESLDRQAIANLPALNGDITSALRLNPNIQYAEAAQSSLTGGEIAPAEISIHGAKPYQNEILLDGVSIANDLDPGNKVTPSSADFIPGTAQALAVDSGILCDVEVKDANVSAEYGRFTGGVVTSTICNARKRLGGSVSAGYSSSAWSTLFIDPARQQEFEQSSDANMQPRFRKYTYRATAEARPGEGWGVLVSAVRRKSEIPLRRFDTANEGSTVSREVVQTRQQDTLVMKADYAPAGGRHKGDVSFVHAPAANTYFMKNFRDSDYTIDSGGLSLGGRLESRFGAATLTHQLSFARNEQSRRSDADYYRQWRWSADKDWGDAAASTNPTSGEGASGDVDQAARSVGYRLKAAFAPFALGGASHRVTGGVELRRQHARYERLKDQYYYSTITDLPATLGACRRPDGGLDTEGCSATPTLSKGVGQYFRTLLVYHRGSFTVDSNAWAAWLEDEASWGAFVVRAGLRADRDSLAGKANLAPRLMLGWQATSELYLDVGANRYYGRNLFAYALQEKVNTLKTEQTRRGTLAWSDAVSARPLNRFEDVRSPHDDELAAGATFDADPLGGPLSVRFTRRDGKDQVVRVVRSGQADCNGNSCYVFTNNGAGSTRDVTVSWSSARAFKVAGSANRMWVAFNRSDVKSNYSTYAANYGSALLDDELIRYDGRILRHSDMPAGNYNRPWTLRVGAMTTLPARQLTVSNLLRIRGGFEQVLLNGTYVHEGTTIDNYERTLLPRAGALDTVMRWTPRIHRGGELDVKLTIENVTNRKNRIAVNDTYATYERGRTFALEIGYAF